MSRAKERPTDRQRIPQPFIRYRLPSGRGAMEQPNAVGDGDTPLSGAFWLAVVLTGVAAGLFGDLMMLLLFSIQHLAFNYRVGDLQSAAERASDLRRIASLLIAGGFGGVAWFVLRKWTPGESSDIDDSLWRSNRRLDFRRSFGTSVISEVVIGMGASIGREAAPKLLGGVSGSLLAGWFRLSPAQRRLLVACGGGAGLAAVYNVPLGGALFTAEVLYGSMALPVVLPALACCSIATVVSWLYLPDRPTYLSVPAYHSSGSLFIASLVVGVLVGVLAIAYVRLIGWVSHHRVTGRLAIGTPIVGFGVLGLIGFRYPQLFGNGKDMAETAFLGLGSVSLLFALFVLKPLVTALCLGSGASGGLFTPTLSTGALFGAFFGLVWTHVDAGAPSGALAMVAASAMIGAAMQAPLAGLVFVLELTSGGFPIVVPMLVATVLATAIARYVDGYSIYTARLPASVEFAEGRAAPTERVTS